MYLLLQIRSTGYKHNFLETGLELDLSFAIVETESAYLAKKICKDDSLEHWFHRWTVKTAGVVGEVSTDISFHCGIRSNPDWPQPVFFEEANQKLFFTATIQVYIRKCVHGEALIAPFWLCLWCAADLFIWTKKRREKLDADQRWEKASSE